MNQSAVVIIGAGQAGCQAAASLRQGGFEGSITLVNGEPGLPYQRPPLSKGYLLGKVDAAKLLLRRDHWYPKQRVDLISDQVVAIDRAGHQVQLAGGPTLAYDHLILATGSRNRELPVPGAELGGVIGMRTQADADALAGRVGDGVEVVVVGAGFIGLEFAAVAAALGASVHVLEQADRPMARAVSAATSDFFRQAHEDWGVRLEFGRGVIGIGGDNGVATSATLTDARIVPADLVVYGIGVVPETTLAERAGLGVDNGIRVDEQLLTDDPDISAIGDAVSFPSAYAGGRMIRLECVQNAADQARHVAARLTGASAAYDALPWFWSDQGDLKLQIAGLADTDDDSVELVSPEPRQRTVLRYRADRLVAVETVNRPGDHMLARRILAGSASSAGPTSAEATVAGFDLKTWHEAQDLVAAG
ncbi:NAD/ferredoxin-dependent reductase-like protein [Antricoccus suffuscus]|uniref:NAD/ferredoxin-dependent reductase-like protein n=1 Tax=Antricoccus suffuscus TaxID=1629062 RepID=A0A2T1A3E5_9ACTN|nr:FAD-dependent oxidoreductase [Antricoccus suffuscus]PRZ42828.1 NAD/ferredoxin-dependent reductase-like protein [Antricoccus suffuscus]